MKVINNTIINRKPRIAGLFYCRNANLFRSKLDLFLVLIEEMIFSKMITRVFLDVNFLAVLEAPFPLL